MTLNDILNDRKALLDEFEEEQEPTEFAEPSEEIDFAKKLEMEQKTNAEELMHLIKNMMRYEKEAVVKSIPTDILQNEISHRMNSLLLFLTLCLSRHSQAHLKWVVLSQ